MANASAQGRAPRRVLLSAVDRLVLRVAFGATLAFSIAMILDWEYGFLAPLLTASLLLAMPAIPRFGQGIAIPLVATVSCNVGLVAAHLFAATPLALMLFVALTVLLAAYGQRRGMPAILMLLVQISVVIVAIFSVTSQDVAREFSDFFQRGSLAAAGSVWLAHALIPAPPAPPKAAPAPAGLPPAWAARVAICDTLIIMPLIVSFMLESATDDTVYVTTALIVLGQLEPTARGRDAYNRLIGQVLGGLMAVVSQQFIFLADSLVYFLATVFLGALWLARRVVTSGPAAGLYVQALSGFILVLGLGLAQGGSEEYYGIRILKITIAVLYTYGALSLLFRLRQVPPAPGR